MPPARWEKGRDVRSGSLGECGRSQRLRWRSRGRSRRPEIGDGKGHAGLKVVDVISGEARHSEDSPTVSGIRGLLETGALLGHRWEMTVSLLCHRRTDWNWHLQVGHP